ncbi:concanavalin A-like lectin/glucanase [Mytilinidion resinicola]|uniref:Concanavalin A-like lectin/glucanase n=1 Tax=Mytilinidion resinicola TaxID=574789 RepID=A0A6A6YZJ6_9PEZI|nr:concanavalin A-like lectin/glucanase [Mytilinidion resinicola]KAF2813345.1 concanavalin A-like lectin/glucanase [Mytilinidion resinicola]
MRSSTFLPLFSMLGAFRALSLADDPRTNPAKDNSPNCSCYTVDGGNDTAYFTFHRFWDFRNLSPDHLTSDAWNADWWIQNWTSPASSDSPLERINLVENVGILTGKNGNGTALTLNTYRNNSHTQFTAEIQSMQQNIKHASIRFHARVVGSNGSEASKGACAGLFTWSNDDNESDIEILTQDPLGTIRYTNQPDLDKAGNAIPQASITSTALPPWSLFHTHRIDWLAHATHWFLDDALVAANTYSVPQRPSGIFMNLWGDGGSWTGEMAQGGSAVLVLEWVEAVFNTSGPVKGPGKRAEGKCGVVCRVDGVREIGWPEVYPNSKN